MNRRELIRAAGAALAGATVLPYLPGPAPVFTIGDVVGVPMDASGAGGYLVPEHFAREFLKAWEKHYLYGAGSAEPKGILNAP